MAKNRFYTILFFLPGLLMGYESNLLNMVTPSSLGSGYAEFSVQHQFYTPAEKLPDTWFGDEPGSGANPGFGLRLNIGKGVELKTAYSVNNPSRAYSVGAAYVAVLPVLKQNVQVDVSYFNMRVAPGQREGNAFFLLSWTSNPLLDRVRLVCNLGYNHYNEKLGTAVGLSLALNEKIRLVGEYYPATDPLDLDLKNTLVLGIDYATYGHHFLIKLSNNVENGVRRLMRGSATNDLYLGFAIYRMLQF